jgi:hypothetical protein
MAWSRPRFSVGLNALNLGLANEGGYFDSNFVRFYQGLPQTLGGWQLHTTQTFTGTARGSHDWLTLEGKKTMAWGTESKLYCEIAGAQRDITPNLHETVLTDCFTTEDTSDIVTVYFPFHRLKAGEEFTLSNHQSTVGGLSLEGTFTVLEVQTLDRFTFQFTSDATSTVSTPSGGNVDFVAALPAGLTSNPLVGYGSGTYGEGGYGASTDTTLLLRTWSLGNWGEFLLANPSGYGIFEFQPELNYIDLAFNGDFTGNADGWGLGTGWAYATNNVEKTAGTASNLAQDVERVLEGGRYYIVQFDVTRTAGSIKFQVNAGDPAAVIDVGTASAAITKSGTYTRLFLCPADPMDVVFAADATFAGTIDNVSYQLIDRAYRIVTAPARVDAMSIDPKGIVLAYGCSLIDGSYSATTIRCSDIGNNRSWVPDTGSLASEITLNGVGGRLMAGLSTREQNIVWSDQRALALEYQGQEGAAFEPFDLGGGIGLISRHAMAEHQGFVFWMTPTRQIRIFRGIGALSKGSAELMFCPISNEIFDNIDYLQALKIHAGINPEFAECWFFVPDTRDGNECSRAYAVSWAEADESGKSPWVKHQLARTSWRPSGTFEKPVGFAPPVNGSGRIFDHEEGYTSNGQPLNEYLQTAPFDAGEGETLMAISKIIPHFSNQSGNVDLTLYTQPSPNGAERTFGPYRATPTTEFLPIRVMGRQVSLRMEGKTAGGFWRLGALRIDAAPTQARR